ncbi:hypothetical protein F5X99DRAFT_407083 [Biscogniauxia marginata]|nr:hypothetical protein F5X99DRAFT_407083 [Biscogniauxia marginata]
MFSLKTLLLTLPLMGLVRTWEVTSYSGVDNCKAGSGTKYRIYEGGDSGTCHELTGSAAGSTCSQYSNGGTNGPDSCGGDYLLAQSVSTGGCTVYTGKNCGGADYTGNCVTPGFGLTLASFRCMLLYRSESPLEGAVAQ